MPDGSFENLAIPTNFKLFNSVWCQFCLHQFITQSLENILSSILKKLGRENDELNLDELIKNILNDDFYIHLKNITGQNCATPLNLLELLGIKNKPDKEMSLQIQASIPISHHLSEYNLLNNQRTEVSDSFVRSIVVLSVIYCKWRGLLSEDEGIKLIYKGVYDFDDEDYWIKKNLKHFDNWLNPEFTWEDLVLFVIKEFIIKRHNKVKNQRGNEKIWIEWNDPKIKRIQGLNTPTRSSRHINCIYILLDLHLLEINEEGYIIVTSDGLAIIDRVCGEDINVIKN